MLADVASDMLDTRLATVKRQVLMERMHGGYFESTSELLALKKDALPLITSTDSRK